MTGALNRPSVSTRRSKGRNVFAKSGQERKAERLPFAGHLSSSWHERRDDCMAKFHRRRAILHRAGANRDRLCIDIRPRRSSYDGANRLETTFIRLRQCEPLNKESASLETKSRQGTCIHS